MVVLWVFLILLFGTSVQSDSVPEQSCSKPKIPEVKFSISTRRNYSGHWRTQIILTPGGGNSAASKTGLWTVEFEKTSATGCEGDEGINIIATITGSQIPDGYELFPGVGYYKFHPEDVIMARARQVCAEEGAHLAIINSENEANVLKQLFTRFPKEKLNSASAYNSLALGVYEQGVNGQYFTIFGEPLNSTGFNRWSPGKPHLTGPDDCVYLLRFDAGLEDLSCVLTSPFVCELPHV